MKTLLYSYFEPKGKNITELPFGDLHYLMPPYKKLKAIKYNCKGCDTKIIEVWACDDSDDEQEEQK